MSNQLQNLFDIPEDAELASWIEKQLTGLRLRDLVIGLAAIRDDHASKLSLDDICGSSLEVIATSGLQALSTEQLRSLLKNPYALLDLQEHILIHGGSYWDTVELSPDDKNELDASLSRTLSTLREKTRIGSQTTPQPIKTLDKDETTRSYHRYWPVLVLAAALLIAVGIWPRGKTPNGGGWGFDQDGLLTANVSAKEYMKRLSEAAASFSKKTPESREGALKRLREFKVGCEKLIAAPHPQLTKAEDRDWLITKCKNWLGKIEMHIADIEQGKKDWREVILEASETANRIKDVLQKQADEMA